AAAFYVGALGLLVLVELIPPTGGSDESLVGSAFRRNLWTLGGLGISFGIVGAFFVLPHWTDYRFYNWQVSVTRKPSYDLASLVQRLTWFPVLHDNLRRLRREQLAGRAHHFQPLLARAPRDGAGGRVGGGALADVFPGRAAAPSLGHDRSAGA